MRPALSARTLALLGAMALGGGTVLAQNGAPAAAPPTSLPGESTVAPPSNLTPNEMVGRANEYVANMDTILTQVLMLQEIALKNKDVIKLNCINDKLMQLKQVIPIAQQANTDMHVAIARADNDGRLHQFDRIEITYQRAQELHSEANACVGEELSYVGATEVEVTVDPSLPTDDPTAIDDLPVPIIERPPLASPF